MYYCDTCHLLIDTGPICPCCEVEPLWVVESAPSKPVVIGSK